MYQALTSLLGGVALSISVGSPAEWMVHKYILHATPRQRKRMSFIRNASIGHNDKHHGAYKGPAHYYRDITNENEVIHFSKKDVGVIAGVGGIIGLAADRGYSAIAGKSSFGVEDAAFVAGMIGGTLGYYGIYEFTHHYMHAIGKRRLSINRALGDIMQDNERDGNLRFSKPLLDDICSSVESRIDKPVSKRLNKFYFEPNLIKRLEKQTKINRNNEFKGNHEAAKVSAKNSEDTLNQLVAEMLHREEELISKLSPSERTGHFLERKVQKYLRKLPLFQYLDNHHLIHHFRYGSNLNVVFPLMDVLMRTERDSSGEELEKNRDYWLCPNSPDLELFSLPVNNFYSH